MKTPQSFIDRDLRMEEYDNLCITEHQGILVVDFQGCDARRVASVYRSLAVDLLDSATCLVLLKSGLDAPEGHVTLPDVLRLVMRHRNAWRDFSLALLPQTERARWVFEQVLLQYRSSGLRMVLFDDEAQAHEWLRNTAEITVVG